LEHWNNGKRKTFFVTQYSSTPSLHHSIR
jgi:hypothetical protein